MGKVEDTIYEAKMTGKVVAVILVCLLAVGLAHDKNCATLGLLASNPASSCNEIYQHNIASRGNSGHYWINTTQGLHEVKCKMDLQCGGVEGGWMQVVDVNMADYSSCPGAWRMITSPKKLCVGGVNAGCDSAHFHTRGIHFQHICGQTKSYQKGYPDAFSGRSTKGIDETYVDGISITLGSPRQHIWTYGTSYRDDYRCPCAPSHRATPSAFVDSNYYCESGTNVEPEFTSFYLSDPLWDGQDCPANSGCCAQLGMPWFYRRTPVPLSENIEVRICKDEVYADEDTAVEKMEIYVL